MQIRGKFNVYFLSLTIIPLLVSGLLHIRLTRDATERTAIEQNHFHVQFVVDQINTVLDEYRATALLLRDLPPAQGIIRARETGVDPLDGSTLDLWRQRYETIFTRQIEVRPSIHAISYVDIEGDELARVSREYGTLQPISPEQMSSVAEDDFFKPSLARGKDDVYLSEIHLFETTVTSEPFPSFYVTTPVFDEVTNLVNGLIVMQYNLTSFLDQAAFTTTGHTVITDQTGQFIYHPDPTRAFTDVTYFQEQPELQENARVFDAFDFHDVDEAQYRFWRKVFYDPSDSSRYWIFTSVIGNQELFQDTNVLALNLLGVLIGSVLVVLVVALVIAGTITSPIRTLRDAAKDIGRRRYKRALTTLGSLSDRQDEIGQLSQSVLKMGGAIQAFQKNLESQVKTRTSELTDIYQRDASILESVSEGLVFTDTDGHVALINRAATLLVGMPEEKAVGAKIESVIKLVTHSKKLNTRSRLFTTVVKQNTSIDSSFSQEQVFLKSGRKKRTPIVYTATPVTKNGEVLGVLVLLRDITREKAIDKAKNEFVSLASHQMRTPVTSIKWYAEGLLEGDFGRLSKSMREPIENIHQSGEHVAGLIRALLNVTRIDLDTFRIRPEMVSLRHIVQGAMRDLERAATEKQVTIKTSFAKKLTRVSVDVGLMTIIIQNVLSNAVKYSKPGGTVWVSVRAVKEGVKISVKDEGYGIPEHQHGKIFTKLFRADNAMRIDTEGNGLGLYIVKSILEKVGGRIWFESTEDVGTQFFVLLPPKGMQAKPGDRELIKE